MNDNEDLILESLCPFKLGCCTTSCMLFLEHAPTHTVIGNGDNTGHCAFAVLASHIASTAHQGGNYLMRTAILGEDKEKE